MLVYQRVSKASELPNNSGMTQKTKKMPFQSSFWEDFTPTQPLIIAKLSLPNPDLKIHCSFNIFG